MEQFIKEVLKNSYDLHVHSSLVPNGSLYDDIEILQDLDSYQMAGAVFKNNESPSCTRAYSINSISGTKAKMLGSFSMARVAGGINRYAVKNALRHDAKLIWLPTVDYPKGLTVVDESGKLLPQIYECLEVLAGTKIWLATGHISAEEALLVCTEARKMDIRCILTHPETKKIPLDTQKKLADMGVMQEKVWCSVQHQHATTADLAANIRAIGAERCFLATDFGQRKNPLPTKGFAAMIRALLAEGISENDIYRMAHINPIAMMET